MTNISEAIKKATKILKESDILEPLRETKSLLSLAIEKDKTFLIAHNEYELTKKEEKLFWGFIKRRSNREPFQHIAGKQEFWGLDFIVNQDVLIPRPETELIVEEGIKILKEIEKPTFCEIGIGSGCIAISILHEFKNARATAFDISERALKVAEQNADKHNVLNRLTLVKSDIFKSLNESTVFDLIVSNPPYVPAEDIPNLQSEVKDFDPQIALTDGKDGLSIVRKIIDESPNYLKSNGYLLLEIGFNQSNKVRKMFDLEIWQEVDFHTDLQGIPRVVEAKMF